MKLIVENFCFNYANDNMSSINYLIELYNL